MPPSPAHDHSHAGHSHHPSGHTHGHVSAAALRTAFFVNLAFTLVEVVGGWWSGSIAVLRSKEQELMDALERL